MSKIKWFRSIQRFTTPFGLQFEDSSRNQQFAKRINKKCTSNEMYETIERSLEKNKQQLNVFKQTCKELFKCFTNIIFIILAAETSMASNAFLSRENNFVRIVAKILRKKRGKNYLIKIISTGFFLRSSPGKMHQLRHIRVNTIRRTVCIENVRAFSFHNFIFFVSLKSKRAFYSAW